MRKPATCIYENKDADQLRGNPEADQRLCFRYTDSTIPLPLKSEISSLLLWLYSPVCVGPGRKPRKTGFLTTRLIFVFILVLIIPIPVQYVLYSIFHINILGINRTFIEAIIKVSIATRKKSDRGIVWKYIIKKLKTADSFLLIMAECDILTPQKPRVERYSALKTVVGLTVHKNQEVSNFKSTIYLIIDSVTILNRCTGRF